MRILLVFPFVPYPPDDGGRIGFFNPIKYLSRSNDVSVVTFAKREDEDAVKGLKGICESVFVFNRPAGDRYRLIRGVFGNPPASSAKYWHVKAGEFIRSVASSRRSEIVEFHHLNTAAYRPFVADIPAILREHNVEYKVWERYAKSAPRFIERSYARWMAPRVRDYEAKCAANFDRCVVVSKADAAFLKAISPGSAIEVVPSGVDTEYFRPIDLAEEPFSITMTGSFGWPPKQQSLLALFKRVIPRIKALVPQARFYIVGKGIPEYLRDIGRQTDGLTIVGEVSDVRPYVARSALLINYLESGGGIALKLLEAMAMQRPVLSNALGSEGIEVEHGRDVFVADGPEAFAAAAACLLKDQGMRYRLAAEGYRKVLASYSWNSIATRFADIYHDLVIRRREPSNLLAEAAHV